MVDDGSFRRYGNSSQSDDDDDDDPFLESI